MCEQSPVCRVIAVITPVAVVASSSCLRGHSLCQVGTNIPTPNGAALCGTVLQGKPCPQQISGAKVVAEKARGHQLHEAAFRPVSAALRTFRLAPGADFLDQREKL